MLIVCPDCGADGQEVGKYCENCGRLLTAADAQAGYTPPPQVATPVAPAPPWNAPDPSATLRNAAPVAPAGVNAQSSPYNPQSAGARFAVVGNGHADPADGFTITAVGEFLVGRPNLEAGTGVDVDVRQWVQPFESNGQKQYLVHRSQCFLGLAADGAVTIRACAGAEEDTLVKPGDRSNFVPLAHFGTVRNLRSDSAYPLQRGDQLFMGDPTAIPYFQTGAPTAQGTYLVLELV